MSNDETSFRHDVLGASETAKLQQQGDAGSNSHSLAQSPVGFVGMGHMGTAMAANLAAAGYWVNAYVRHADQMAKLTALGLQPTTNIADLFDCEVVPRTTTPFARLYSVARGSDLLA
jgi:phosphoglycerate dehydrogenase-like enzyme